ncbi:MAG: hypothetical protein II961_06820 [Candidatus Riflebacteria bacterium]|nr:hypothetical protein [Candidatus Riflebacteria bacterium]
MQKSLISAFILGLLLCGNCYAQEYTINNGRKVFASPSFEEGPKTLFATSGSEEQLIANLASSSPALPLAKNGLDKMRDGNFQDAKEAFRTALRLEPMNMALWQLYDDSVIGEYTTGKRDEVLKAVVTADIKPTFAITRIDSYLELGTLYIVGTLKNVSDKKKQKINLRTRLLDKNKRELRSEYGTLRDIYKVLYPNESTLFEIPIKNPPTNVKSYRVEVSSWED